MLDKEKAVWEGLEPFDHRKHLPEFLARSGRLAIITALPPRGFVSPGDQIHTPILTSRGKGNDWRMTVHMDIMGSTVGDSSSAGAAGRALRQHAYHTGWRSGQAGSHFDGQKIIPLATASFKHALLAQQEDEPLAALSVVSQEKFSPDKVNVLGTPISWETVLPERVAVLNLASVALLLGEAGIVSIDSIVEPQNHPEVSRQFAATHADMAPW